MDRADSRELRRYEVSAMSSNKSSPHPSYALTFGENVYGYARGAAGVLPADFVGSSSYAVLSTVLDSSFSHIFLMLKRAPVANFMTFCDVIIIVQEFPLFFWRR